MKDLILICQVFYRDSILHSGVYELSKKIPEFNGEFYIPSEITVGPIDCRLTIMDTSNCLIAYKTFMAPASGTLITRMLNIYTLNLIKGILEK